MSEGIYGGIPEGPLRGMLEEFLDEIRKKFLQESQVEFM